MEAIEFLLSGICHQLPPRCLHYEGQPLPLCARCMGTFLGIVGGLLALRAMGQGRRSALPDRPTSAVLGVLVAIWGIDGLNSLSALVFGMPLLYAPLNALRLATGVGIGLALSAVIYPIYHGTLWRQVDAGRVLEQARHVVGLLLVGGMLTWGVWHWRSASWAFWTVTLTGAVATVLTMINATLCALLLRKEGVANRWYDLAPWGLAGLALSLLELSTLALLRSLWVGYSLASWQP